MTGNSKISRQEVSATTRKWLSRARALAILALMLGTICGALLLVQRAERPVISGTSAPDTVPHQVEANGVFQALRPAENADIAMPSPTSRMPSSLEMSQYPGRQVEFSAPGLLRDALQYSELHVAGQLRAIRVSPGRDVQIFQQFGLRPGDLITAVNGTSVDGQLSGELALEPLGNSSGGELTFVRNGSLHKLTIQLVDVSRGQFK